MAALQAELAADDGGGGDVDGRHLAISPRIAAEAKALLAQGVARAAEAAQQARLSQARLAAHKRRFAPYSGGWAAPRPRHHPRAPGPAHPATTAAKFQTRSWFPAADEHEAARRNVAGAPAGTTARAPLTKPVRARAPLWLATGLVAYTTPEHTGRTLYRRARPAWMAAV